MSFSHLPQGRLPYRRVIVVRRPSRRLKLRSFCLFGCLIPLGAMFACTVVFFIVYLLFPPEQTDIVIMGIDARPGEGYLTRTDSMMLMNINPGDIQVSLLSIPRDVFIRVPDYGEQRINTINLLGEQEAEGYGPVLVKASFQESFGVEVEYYVRIDFNGFVALIDAVGGVTIDVPKLIIDYDYPTFDYGTITVQFDPGKQHMDGERALQYARTRHQDDDYQRAGRQQQVIDALIKKLADPRQIVNWPAVIYAVRSNMDTDMSTWDMIRFGPALVLGWTNKEQRVLEREDLMGGQGAYAIPNYDRLLPWIEAHFD
jgi:LCP family protein required for cell wall assembly